jgi:hypothetical protein
MHTKGIGQFGKRRWTWWWLGALLVGLWPYAGGAEFSEPGSHYLNALSSLRSAYRLMATPPDDIIASGHQNMALDEISAAIDTIRQSVIDDGRDIDDQPAVGLSHNNPRHLRWAADVLRHVRSDIAGEDPAAAVRGVQRQAIDHVDQALNLTETAIGDVERNR